MDIYSWSFPFSVPFIWLFIRRTLNARPKVFLLENIDWMPDAPNSVNRVLLLLLFSWYYLSSFEPAWLGEATIREW